MWMIINLFSQMHIHSKNGTIVQYSHKVQQQFTHSCARPWAPRYSHTKCGKPTAPTTVPHIHFFSSVCCNNLFSRFLSVQGFKLKFHMSHYNFCGDPCCKLLKKTTLKTTLGCYFHVLFSCTNIPMMMCVSFNAVSEGALFQYSRAFSL